MIAGRSAAASRAAASSIRAAADALVSGRSGTSASASQKTTSSG